MLLLRFGFSPMDGAMRMLGRCVDDIQLERSAARIREIMPHTGRHHDRVVVMNFFLIGQLILTAAHLNKALPLLNSQELIYRRMDLQSDILAGIDAHQGNLKMIAGP